MFVQPVSQCFASIPFGPVRHDFSEAQLDAEASAFVRDEGENGLSGQLLRMQILQRSQRLLLACTGAFHEALQH